MPQSVLVTGGFWRGLAERVARQLAQTALPIVAAIGAAGTIDAKAVLIALGGAAVLTIIKALALVKYALDEDPLSALLDRAAPAVAGTALGMLPVDALDITTVDWGAVVWASLAAGAIAMLSYYIAPPALSVPTPLEHAPTEEDDRSAEDSPLGADEVL